MPERPGVRCRCLCVCVCVFLLSPFYVCTSPTLLLPSPQQQAPHVPPHTRRMQSRSIRLQPIPTLPHPQRQRKEQESIEMNGQPSASWLELNGNVKLATDPFCLSVEGPRLTGEHKQDNTASDCQRLTVHFISVLLNLAVCGQRQRE